MYNIGIWKCVKQSLSLTDDDKKRRRRRKKQGRWDVQSGKNMNAVFFFHWSSNFCGLFERKRAREREREKASKNEREKKSIRLTHTQVIKRNSMSECLYVDQVKSRSKRKKKGNYKLRLHLTSNRETMTKERKRRWQVIDGTMMYSLPAIQW